MKENEMTLIIKSLSVNESFARSAVAGFCVCLNPTIDEIMEIKTAVSEAVTNCVVHAYKDTIGDIVIKMKTIDNKIYISVSDNGIGIEDIDKAKQPFFTTKPDEERSGMGFTVMESFMDNIEVFNNETAGVTVKMYKELKSQNLMSVGG